MDKMEVKELGNGSFELTLEDEQYKLLSEHAEQAKMKLEDYIVSILKEYVEILSENLVE